MRRRFRGLLAAAPVPFALLASALPAGAAWLRDLPVAFEQPDGSVVRLLATGDEFFHRVHDADGFAVVRDPADGRLVYARSGASGLEPTLQVAGRDDPSAAGLVPGLWPSAAAALRSREDRWGTGVGAGGGAVPGSAGRPGTPGAPGGARGRGGAGSLPARPSGPTSGLLQNVVIFIRFSDETEFGETAASYEQLFNQPDPGANSMANYFFEASYGSLRVATTFYGVNEGWVLSYQDPHPRGYFRPRSASNPDGYAGDAGLREQAMLAEAVAWADPLIPDDLAVDSDGDGKVDNVCFVVRGAVDGWGDLLWPHMWVLYTTAATINGKLVSVYNFQLQDALPSAGNGVLCHEMFHSLGAPDLYHYSPNGITPVGSWDLMEHNTNPPQHMSSYMKMRYGGWIDSLPEIPSSGVFALAPLAGGPGRCYRIPSPHSAQQYFVVEYRRRASSPFEVALPGDGLVVFRVDGARDGTGNAEGPPDELFVFRPGGRGGAHPVDGEVAQAFLSQQSGRTAIGDATEPAAFLRDGGPGGLDLREIGAAGETIRFRAVLAGGAPECATTAGDANGDGGVDVLDVVAVVNHILEETTLSEGGRACADGDGNGVINVLDLVAMVATILGGAPRAAPGAEPPGPAIPGAPAASKVPGAGRDPGRSGENSVPARIAIDPEGTRILLDGRAVHGLEVRRRGGGPGGPGAGSPRAEEPGGASLSGHSPEIRVASRGPADPGPALLAWSDALTPLGPGAVVVRLSGGRDLASSGPRVDAVPGAAGELALAGLAGWRLVLAGPAGEPLGLRPARAGELEGGPPEGEDGAGGSRPDGRPDRGPAGIRAAAPNPSAGSVEILLRLPEGPCRLEVFDAAGRCVRSLLDGSGPGLRRVLWDGDGDGDARLSSGAYFLRLVTASGVETRSVVRLR